MLTCWPKGFLDRHEAFALLEALDVEGPGNTLTTEEQTAAEKLGAAIGASPEDIAE